MKKYIAYFDFLGFRKFIEKNSIEDQKLGMGVIFREIEQAISGQKVKLGSSGMVADLEEAKVNCLNFSDTVIFWTENDDFESLMEIINVSFIFNWRTNGYFFPARGCVVYGELEAVDYSSKNTKGLKYNINSVYGKGLISAYEKAESQEWAGTVIDQSVIDQILFFGKDPELLLESFAIKYPVPYKNKSLDPQFVLNIVKERFDSNGFEYWKRNIKKNFEDFDKGPLDDRIINKYENTLKFLKHFFQN